MLRLTVFWSLFMMAIAANMEVVYEWKFIDYLWESSTHRNEYIDSGKYNHTNIFTIDVDKARDGRIFLSTPRQAGVPASLSTVSRKHGKGGPLLEPYPDWSWHEKCDCTGITSVYRVAIDECNRMWVLDTGKNGDEQVCPAQLLAFDLFNNELIKSVLIPNHLSHNPKNTSRGLLITPVVETKGRNCEEVHVYMADVDGRGLVIWNGREIWRLDNEVFYPEEAASTLTIAGESFYLDDGLFGLAISPMQKKHGERYLHFRPLASFKEYSVSLNELRRPPKNEGSVRYNKYDYTLPSQGTAQAFSKNGILFFGLVTETAIACWNRKKTMNNENVVIVAQNETTLQFASGVKVVQKRWSRNEELWVTTNRLQKIWLSEQNFSEVNYRILKASVSALTKGTNCEL